MGRSVSLNMIMLRVARTKTNRARTLGTYPCWTLRTEASLLACSPLVCREQGWRSGSSEDGFTHYHQDLPQPSFWLSQGGHHRQSVRLRRRRCPGAESRLTREPFQFFKLVGLGGEDALQSNREAFVPEL